MPFIVVGIDGSASSQAALVAAIAQAELIDAEVRVVNVVSFPAMSGYELGPIDFEAMTQAAQQTVNTAIEGLASVYGEDLPVKVTSEVLTGHIGIEILRAAEKDGGAAMVVSGSRGYGGLKSMLLGSVTTYLSHHLNCPLLIIPGPPE